MPKGYGTINIGGRMTLAHRASYAVANGPIDPGLVVCHRCDTPACVNPDHLFVGTHKDNTQDCVRKGRIRNGPSQGEQNANAKLNWAKVHDIRASLGTGEHPRRLAEVYGVSIATIRSIDKGRIWRLAA